MPCPKPLPQSTRYSQAVPLQIRLLLLHLPLARAGWAEAPLLSNQVPLAPPLLLAENMPGAPLPMRLGCSAVRLSPWHLQMRQLSGSL